jgi:hypothetical protein
VDDSITSLSSYFADCYWKTSAQTTLYDALLSICPSSEGYGWPYAEATRRDSLKRALLSCHRKSVSLSSWSSYFGEVSERTLGECLAELSTARDQIDQLLEFVCPLAYSFSTNEGGRDTDAPVFTDEDVFKAIEEAKQDLQPIGVPALLDTLAIQEIGADLFATILKRVKALRMALASLRWATFCGQNWCKRKWFQMHGCRPPRTGTIAIHGFDSGRAQA